MKLFKYILFSLLLLIGSVGYGQNNLITPAPLGRFALSFDGVDEYYNFDDLITNELSGTSIGSWSFWVKPVLAIPSSVETLLSFGDTDAATQITITQRTGDGDILVLLQSSGTLKWQMRTLVTPFTDNTWAHVAVTHDGTAPKCYLNGADVTTFVGGLDNKFFWFSHISGIDNARFGITDNNNDPTRLFNGSVDEISIWNTTLSLTEIQEIYNNNKPTNLRLHSKYANLLAWYQMGEFSSYDGTNWNIIDASVNDNPGVSVNMEESDRVVSTLIYEQPVRILRVGNNLITSP